MGIFNVEIVSLRNSLTFHWKDIFMWSYNEHLIFAMEGFT